MQVSVIIIAIIFDERNGSERVTEIFDTEYLTQAYTLMEQKYQGFDIEYLYVFDSHLNLIERMKLLIKGGK
jgi:hypothetical protein